MDEPTTIPSPSPEQPIAPTTFDEEFFDDDLVSNNDERSEIDTVAYENSKDTERQEEEQDQQHRRKGSRQIMFLLGIFVMVFVIAGGSIAAALLLTNGSVTTSHEDFSEQVDAKQVKTISGDSTMYEMYTCNINVTMEDYDDKTRRDLQRVDIFSHDVHDGDTNQLPIDEYARPLECNRGMVDALKAGTSCCNTTLSAWRKRNPLMGSQEEFIVPCGTCIVVDIDNGGTLELPMGLRIEGMLYVPPSAHLTIRTTHIWVLGILKIDPPNPTNQIKFTLYGDEDVAFENTGGYSSLGICRTGSCDLGTKPFAVVGGRLEIQGYDPKCIAWEKLEAVLSPTPAPSCGFQDLIQNGNMEDNSDISMWGGYGNNRTYISPGYGDSKQAISAIGGVGINWSRGIFQIIDFSCLEKGKEWIVRAKVKLSDSITGEPVSCDTQLQNDCPLVRLDYTIGEEHKFFEYYSADLLWAEGDWNDLEVVVPIEVEGIERANFMLCGGREGTTLDIDDISMVPKEDPINQIVVSAKAAECWTPGSELLLTSHTRNFRDHQVVMVEYVDISSGVITLNQTINRPLTVEHHGDFAVEVASLSRPVVFDAESNADDEFIGGHLIIYHTLTRQHVEGVEIRNFGQQGRLGRYPTHFHFCGNATGSIMRRNVVRDANQRCYVVHQTNEVILEENVAFNTFGHCYFIEDGVEVGNVFRNNLGAGTMKSTRLLSELSNRVETDDRPSTFWISNPRNYYYSNVAAGSESSGYWFETHNDTTVMSLGAFDDNEAHSNQAIGLTTYSPGWQPQEEAEVRNIKVYRNMRLGMFLHVTRNLNVVGGVVADNGIVGVQVSQGDSIDFVGTKFVGRSSTEIAVPQTCNTDEELVGLSLFPAKLEERDKTGSITGTTLVDVEFINFTPATSGCGQDTKPLVFTSVVLSHILPMPTFDAPHSFSNVTLEAGSIPLDACAMEQNLGIDDVIIEIVDDASASWSKTASPGFLVSPKFTIFLQACTPYSDCLEFCSMACMRTIRFLTNPAADSFIMVISNGIATLRISRILRSTDSVSGIFDGTYNVALPLDSFEVHFEDDTGAVVFPDYVIPVMEAPPICLDYIDFEDIKIIRTNASDPACYDLIKNGDLNSDISGWNELYAGMTWDATGGVGQSGALKTTKRSNFGHSVSQWLNINCIDEGSAYDFTVSFKLLVNETNYPLDCATELCPTLSLQKYWYELDGQIYGPSAAIFKANTVSSQGSDGFHTLTGRWKVTQVFPMEKLLMTFNVYQDSAQYILDSVHAIKL